MFNSVSQQIAQFQADIEYIKTVILGKLSMSLEDRPAFNKAWDEIRKLEFKIRQLQSKKQL